MMQLIQKIIQFFIFYDVFIAVEEQDLRYAENIRDFLRKLGARVFVYKTSISGGRRWREEIKDNLRDCSLFIVLLSSNSIRSPDVRHEIGGAYFSDKDFLPVILEDIPERELGMISEIQHERYHDRDFYNKLKKRMIKVYFKRLILWVIIIALIMYAKFKS